MVLETFIFLKLPGAISDGGKTAWAKDYLSLRKH
jgi:hypothetical protein